MRMQEIRAIARDRGIKADGKLRKAELIRHIQRQEGYFDCFGSARQECAQAGCLWRGDCIGEK